jgi:hypothetical protein
MIRRVKDVWTDSAGRPEPFRCVGRLEVCPCGCHEPGIRFSCWPRLCRLSRTAMHPPLQRKTVPLRADGGHRQSGELARQATSQAAHRCRLVIDRAALPSGVPSARCRQNCRIRNKRRWGRRKEIAICRNFVVPPGWIEQPTPGLGNMRKA